MNSSTKLFNSRNVSALSISSVLVASALPAHAQASPTPADVSSTVSSVGAVAAVAVPVVLTTMGVRLAIKIVNRLTVKG